MYLTQSLHRAIQQTPDGTATIFGSRRRTWREHVDRVARLAGALRALDVADGERVAILSRCSDRYLEALHAIPWANGVVLPVNTEWAPSEIVRAFAETLTEPLLVDA